MQTLNAVIWDYGYASTTVPSASPFPFESRENPNTPMCYIVWLLSRLVPSRNSLVSSEQSQFAILLRDVWYVHAQTNGTHSATTLSAPLASLHGTHSATNCASASMTHVDGMVRRIATTIATKRHELRATHVCVQRVCMHTHLWHCVSHTRACANTSHVLFHTHKCNNYTHESAHIYTEQA